MVKNIDISERVAQTLRVEAAKKGLSYKRYLENLIEDHAFKLEGQDLM